MWGAANFRWHSQNTMSPNILFWHWSPENSFQMNFPISGWDEALITHIVAASSAYYAIDKSVYTNTWVNSTGWRNGKQYYNITLPLGDYWGGGPLFFEQYTFMGIDPRGLVDEYGIDYAGQAVNHTLINRGMCVCVFYYGKRKKKCKNRGKSVCVCVSAAAAARPGKKYYQWFHKTVLREKNKAIVWVGVCACVSYRPC